MKDEQRIIISAGEDISFQTIEEFRLKTKNLYSLSSSLVYIDFAYTENIDSSGIGEIIRLNNILKKNENRLVLVNINPQLLKVLKFVNLNKILPVFKDIEYAFGCEEELKNYIDHKEVKLFLYHKDRRILNVFSHILTAYGYLSVKTTDSIKSIKNNIMHYNDNILILSANFLKGTDEIDIAEIKSKNYNIILSDLYNILEKDELDSVTFKKAITDLFTRIDEQIVKTIDDREKPRSVGDTSEKLAYFKEYINEVIHDISSPLNVFMNTKAMFGDIEETEPELYSAFDMSFKKISQLIDEMKLFIEKEEEVEFQKIYIETLCEELIDMTKNISELERKEYCVNIDESVKGIKIESNKGYIDHLFINLITNAAKYSKRKIGLEALVDDEVFYIKIFDDGDPLDHTLYFNYDGVNYRDIKSTYNRGSGRGIKIIKRIITKLGYELEIKNISDGKYIIIKIPIL